MLRLSHYRHVITISIQGLGFGFRVMRTYSNSTECISLHLFFPPHMQVFSMSQKAITLSEYGILKLPFFGINPSPTFSSLSLLQKRQLNDLKQNPKLTLDQFFNSLTQLKIAHIRPSPIAASAPGADQNSCLSSSSASSSAQSARQAIDEAAAVQ